MNQPYRPLSLPNSEARRTRLSNLDQAAGGVFAVRGMQEVAYQGEALFNVWFPVRFIEIPHFTTGWHLGGLTGSVANLEAGNYPEVHVGVASYYQDPRQDTGSFYYKGASIAVKIPTGVNAQVITIHYRFEGKGLSYLPQGQGLT